jgi:hypothetical protein
MNTTTRHPRTVLPFDGSDLADFHAGAGQRRIDLAYLRSQKPSNNLLSIAVLLTATVSLMCGFEALLLSDANLHLKNLPTTLMCFDDAGHPVRSNQVWRECVQVRYIAPKTIYHVS